MDNYDMTVKGLRSIILFRRLEGRRFRPRLRLPATPKHRATAQDSEQTSPSGMSNYRWHRFVQQPRGYPFVTVNPASTVCHLGVALSSCLAGKVQTLPLWTATRTGWWSGDKARRQSNTRPLTIVASASSLYSTSTITTINLLPGKNCAVVAEDAYGARIIQQLLNDRARDFIESLISMEIVKSTLNKIKYHYFNMRMHVHTHEWYITFQWPM
jgi:hypothetical protein